MESTRHPGPSLSSPGNGTPPQASLPQQPFPAESTQTPLELAIERTSNWLLARQQFDGHWVAELEGDTILESEYILLLAFLGRHECEAARKASEYIRQQQLREGGWAIFPGGGVDISASAKAYFALKLTGHDPEAEYMQRARQAVRTHGGADAVNSFTRFYFALLGQISYDACPAVAPEVMLLPRWFPIDLSKISAWSRTILVPLAIVSALQPVKTLELRLSIEDIFLQPPAEWPPLRAPGRPQNPGLLSWDTFFRVVDRGLKFLSRQKLMPLRQRGVAAAERWMIERFAGSEGLGAIFPPMIWSIVALRALGYSDDSAEVRYCHEHLAGLVIESADSIRLQPCKSPVWDTAITLRALESGGSALRPDAVRRGVDWLISQEVRRAGDWADTVDAEPAGWCFEYANEFYPDVDDTIMVLMAFAEHTAPQVRTAADRQEALQQVAALDRIAAASDRAERWVLAMQNRDGGWGAFDRDNDREFLCHVPFADHNAMIDPSTPDLAGRVLEMLALRGRRVGDAAVDRAVAYIRKHQEADGSWFGRWGVNYIYGTWQVLVGLTAVGVPHDDPAIAAGAKWLLQYQQENGGWGESPASYDTPALHGVGPHTASQTAWALLGLMAAGKTRHPAVARGIDYLLHTQQADGSWAETEYTGTGFPCVFYLRYHYYPIYFPLLALAQFRDKRST